MIRRGGTHTESQRSIRIHIECLFSSGKLKKQSTSQGHAALLFIKVFCFQKNVPLGTLPL